MVEAGTSNDAVDVRIRRHQNGIKLNIRVWPEVEAFFQHWSGGIQESPTHGRLWKPCGGDDPDRVRPLALWAFGMNIASSAVRPYSLVHSGSGFYVDHGYPNISFLRLVGSSAPEGRDLLVETLIGRGEIPQLAQRISEASQLFYNEYLQQVNMRAVVSVYQLPSAA